MYTLVVGQNQWQRSAKNIGTGVREMKWEGKVQGPRGSILRGRDWKAHLTKALSFREVRDGLSR